MNYLSYSFKVGFKTTSLSLNHFATAYYEQNLTTFRTIVRYVFF